jgi:hypothetical protein
MGPIVPDRVGVDRASFLSAVPKDGVAAESIAPDATVEESLIVQDGEPPCL